MNEEFLDWITPSGGVKKWQPRNESLVCKSKIIHYSLAGDEGK